MHICGLARYEHAAEKAHVRHVRVAPPRRFAHLTGHGSYELAFRDASLYSWLLQNECTRCAKPLAAWKPLGNYN